MKKIIFWLFSILILSNALLTYNLFAKIPEPSNVIYGTINISGRLITKADTEITIVAKLSNTIVSSYQMGANVAYGDQYLLKVPLDSIGNRNTNSTQKNDVINIYVSNLLANSVTVGERGSIQENNLVVDATDSDNDGMPDYWETQYGLDINSDDANLDLDSDGLNNLNEYIFGSDPSVADSDGDGMIDLYEYTYNFNPNDPSDGALDTDNDGLTNFEESQNNTNPRAADSDGDGMSDAYEVQYGLNPNSASDAGLDADGDGYTNLEEYQNGTDPTINNSASQSNLTLLAKVNAFDGDISSLESDQNSTFITSHNSNEIKIINNQTGNLERTIPTGSKNGVNTVFRYNDLLFIGTGENQILIWDYVTSTQKAILTDSLSSILSLVADDNHLFAGAADGRIYVWENQSGNFIFDTSWKASSSYITSVGITSDKIYSVSLLPERIVKIWDRLNNHLLLYELTGDVPCCDLSTLSHNNNNLILSGARADNKITTVSLSSMQHEDLHPHNSKVNVVQATDTHFISADRNGEVYIWNQNTNVLLHRFRAHNKAIRSIKIKDGFLITGAVNGEVKVWNYPY